MLLVLLRILDFPSVVIGSLFATVAWITVLVALQDGTRSKVPTALYTFTVSIAIDIVGLIGLFAAPLEMGRAFWLATDGLLATSFIFLVSTVLLLLKDAGPGKFIIMSGAIVLLGIAALGLASVLTG
jgi:hypothetical protein